MTKEGQPKNSHQSKLLFSDHIFIFSKSTENTHAQNYSFFSQLLSVQLLFLLMVTTITHLSLLKNILGLFVLIFITK